MHGRVFRRTVDGVSLPLLRRRREAAPPPPAERPEVRRYRYLLRATDAAVLERLHADALASLDPMVRANILRTAQEHLLSGHDLTVDDVPEIARLVTLGERQTPGIIVSALGEIAIERLSNAVLRRPETEQLLEGYAAWDGTDVLLNGQAPAMTTTGLPLPEPASPGG